MVWKRNVIIVLYPQFLEAASKRLVTIQTGTWASTWPACVWVHFLPVCLPSPLQVWEAAVRLCVSLCSCLRWWSLVRSCRSGWSGAGNGWRRAEIWPVDWSPSWLCLACWGPRTTRDLSAGSCGWPRRTCCSCSPGNAPWTYSRHWTIPVKRNEKLTFLISSLNRFVIEFTCCSVVPWARFSAAEHVELGLCAIV